MKDVKLLLRDPDKRIVDALNKEFELLTKGKEPDPIEITHGHLFDVREATAVVCTGTSFGYLNNFTDPNYFDHFGSGFQDTLHSEIAHFFGGEIPIGMSMNIPTHSVRYPCFIYAPVTRVPMNIANTVNVFLAFRSILALVRQYNDSQKLRNKPPISTLLVPSMGVEYGGMSPERSAAQMNTAYQWAAGYMKYPANLEEHTKMHLGLATCYPDKPEIVVRAAKKARKAKELKSESPAQA